MDIQLLRADITSLKVDAIVNPTSGESSPVGTATVATGGNLLCKFVIHAVPPRAGEGDEDAKLRAATWSALERAEELAIESVGMPAMSAGPQGLPPERCARVMLGATIEFRSRAKSLRRVVYFLFGDESYTAFQRVLAELQ